CSRRGIVEAFGCETADNAERPADAGEATSGPASESTPRRRPDTMLSDLQIAQRAQLLPIAQVAAGLGIEEGELELYGKHTPRVRPGGRRRLAGPHAGKSIDVTAVAPTPLGEGKTTTTIGLTMALNRIGCRAVAAIRQPSLGPVFGIKGGAAGGGYAQVV